MPIDERAERKRLRPQSDFMNHQLFDDALKVTVNNEAKSTMLKKMLRYAAIAFVPYAIFVGLVYFRQRSMLYFPSHHAPQTKLTPWISGHYIIGYCREVAHPRNVWLMLHGNAGQAADRDYVLPCMSDLDSLYVLEYPGYGSRAGSPTLQSLNQAASDAYRVLRSKFPGTRICVVTESIGSGPGSAIALENPPPDKIVLVVPFDRLEKVASGHFPFLPVKFMLKDKWNNVESLAHYSGPIQIFGATGDTIIPVAHAKALAQQLPKSQFIEIPGGHNDWSSTGRVKIE